MIGIYRNLKAKTANDTWSIVDIKLTRDGYISKGKLIDHASEFGIIPTCQTSPQSIASGCRRIASGYREVVAILGAQDVITSDEFNQIVKPGFYTEYLGNVSLSIELQCFTLNGQPLVDFNNIALWFGDTCRAYQIS